MKHIKLFENFKQMKSELSDLQKQRPYSGYDYKDFDGNPLPYDADSRRSRDKNKADIEKRRMDLIGGLNSELERLVDNTTELESELKAGSLDERDIARAISLSIRTLNFDSFELLLDYCDFEPKFMDTVISTYILDRIVLSLRNTDYSKLVKFVELVGEKGFISELSDQKYDSFVNHASHGSNKGRTEDLLELIDSYRNFRIL
jgi:hypothetical protein